MASSSVMLITAAVLGVIVALVAVLALAPRLRLFDDRRTRVGFLVVLAVVALAVPLVAVRVVDRTADDRSADAAEEVYAWLAGRAYDEAVEDALRGEAPGVSAAQVVDGVLVVERPVVVAWQSRCVIGQLPPDGLPEVTRRASPCP